MLTALRRQVQAHLASVESCRKPTLRRSDDPRALLATDLPGIASDEAVTTFITALEQDGWRVFREPGWLMLDYDVPVPASVCPGKLSGEWGCVVWLLLQHPGTDAPKDRIRALVKAAEQGNDKVERLCAAWHGEFAAGLRNHQSLPGGLLPWLLAAMKEETQ